MKIKVTKIRKKEEDRSITLKYYGLYRYEAVIQGSHKVHLSGDRKDQRQKSRLNNLLTN